MPAKSCRTRGAALPSETVARHRKRFGASIITAALLVAGNAAAQPGQTVAAASEVGSKSTESAPLQTDDAARQHVRGCPVGETCGDLAAGLREFEVEAFPRSKGSPWMDDAAHPARPRGHHRRGRKPTDIRPDLPWLAQLKLPGFPVHWDERIIKYLEFYKNDPRGRNIMGAWLRDQGKYRSLILSQLRKAGLPEDLIYVCMIESSYDPGDYSRAGAAGLWQFMRHGGRVYGLRIDRWVDERYDPERSTEAVMDYWRDLYQRFGDWDLAMAAYNAGYAAVLRSIAKYNTNDFWQLLDYENALPWGSSIYVPKALAAAIVGHNRALFGYDDIKPAAELQWDDVNVGRSVSLTTVARAAGVSVDAVVELNPQLPRKRTPPGVRHYVVHVPRGTGELFRARFPRMREEDSYDEYVVRHGERFEDIAAMFAISRTKLREINGIDHESEVEGGDTLLVPRVSEEQRQKNYDKAMDRLYAGGHPAGEPGDKLIVAVPDAEQKVRGKKRVFYRVVTGDTQYGVARAFDVNRQKLAEWNGIDPEGYLHARMVLQLFVSPSFDAAKHGIALLDRKRLMVVTRGSPEHIEDAEARLGRRRVTYTARKRETLAEIGAHYGLSDWDLSRINRMPRSQTVEPGQQIVVYEVVDTSKSDRAAQQARKAAANRPRRRATRHKKRGHH